MAGLEEDNLLTATAPDLIATLPSTSLGYWDTAHRIKNSVHAREPDSTATIILLHSGVQSALAWGYQRDSFARRGLRVIGYSRRGYAGSAPIDPDDPGVAAEDLRDLLDYLAIESAHLVAIAHGGYFALDFVLSWPERVRSLSITSSMMGIHDTEYQAVLERLRPPCFETLTHDMKELGPSYRASNPEGVKAWQSLADQARPGGSTSQSLGNEINRQRLTQIACPTLLMTGDADLYAPPAVLRMQQSLILGSSAVVIPECGHCANWEQPGAFNHHILTFIENSERCRIKKDR